MKKIFVIGLAAALLVVGIVAAHGFGNRYNASPVGNYEEMEQIMDEGSYEDLVNLREELGVNIMPMIDSQEDFELMQEHHEEMEEWHEENGMMRGRSMHRFGGYGRSGGCPMMS